MRSRYLLIAVVCLLMAGCVPTEQQMVDLSDDVDLLHERVGTVNDAVAAAKTLPAKVEAGIEASRPFNPYADEMAAGFGLLTLVGGLFAKKKIDTISAKRAADKQGREATLREIAAMEDSEVSAAKVKSLMYNKIGEARAAHNV